MGRPRRPPRRPPRRQPSSAGGEARSGRRSGWGGGGRSGGRRPARVQQSADPAPVAAERLQQLQHPGVVAAGLAGQRPGDLVRDVVVADADRVRVAVDDPHHLGRGPGADAGDRGQPPGRLGRVGAALQPVRGDRGRPAQGVGPALLDAERVEHPVRRGGDRRRVGRQQQTGRGPGAGSRPAGRGSGARWPAYARYASLPVTFCSRMARSSRWKTRPVAGQPQPVVRRASSATSGCAAASSAKPVRSSRSPATASARSSTQSAPGTVAGRRPARRRCGRRRQRGRPVGGAGGPPERRRAAIRAHGSWRPMASGPTVPAKSYRSGGVSRRVITTPQPGAWSRRPSPAGDHDAAAWCGAGPAGPGVAWCGAGAGDPAVRWRPPATGRAGAGLPSMPRSLRSSPAIGIRFCGARGSLYGLEANRGSVTADRSASAIASRRGQVGRALDPHHAGPRRAGRPGQLQVPGVAGARWCRAGTPGERWPGPQPTDHVVSSGGRYCTRWVLT